MKILRFLFSGLIHNQTIIVDSKKQRWWLVFVVLILSLGIAISPTLISALNSNGGDIITNSEQAGKNLSYSLKRLSYEYLTPAKDKIVCSISTQGELTCTGFEALAEAKKITLETSEDIYFFPITQKLDNEEKITLLVSYVPYKESDKLIYPTIHEKITAVKKQMHIAYPILKDGTPEEVDGYKKSTVYSTLILGKTVLSVELFPNGTTVQYKDASSVKSEPVGDVFSGIYSALTSSYRDLNSFADSEDAQLTVAKWKNFFNRCYEPVRSQLVVTVGLSYTGLNVVLMLVLTLTIYFLARMKSSASGKIPYVACLRMVIFDSLAPAILCAILGSVIPMLQSFGMVLLLGLRVTWLGTKITRTPKEIFQD